MGGYFSLVFALAHPERHLHFEANEYVGGRVRALDYSRIRALLRSWRPPRGRG